MRRSLYFIFLFASFFSSAANISVRLVIRSGNLSFNDGTTIPFKVYTTQPTFEEKSDLFVWQTGDVITLKVVNADTENHGFAIENGTDFGIILAGDSVQQVLPTLTAGVLRYFDPINSPYNEYLGLSGIIHVKEPTDATPYFYWDLREHQELWNTEIIANNSPIIDQYDPFYFTINGNSEPDINTDPIARVTGNVGNEVRVVIVNNGMSIHSMHFHGYHAILLKNSKNSSHEGREKDTFPVYPKEHVVLSFVPDKPGEYPVHDHNLVAVTGGGIYHAGMFTTLLIAP
jgi:FtsP/CotA-like multicopper oxidase with cupredoxin domain